MTLTILKDIPLNKLVLSPATRQEQAWDALSWNKSPEMIRRMLTETHVSARDRRALNHGEKIRQQIGASAACASSGRITAVPATPADCR